MAYHWLLVYSSRRDIGLRIRRVCLLLNLGLVDVRISPGPKTRTFRWNLVTRPTRKDSLLSMSRVPPAILSTHSLFQNDVDSPSFFFSSTPPCSLPPTRATVCRICIWCQLRRWFTHTYATCILSIQRQTPSSFFLLPQPRAWCTLPGFCSPSRSRFPVSESSHMQTVATVGCKRPSFEYDGDNTDEEHEPSGLENDTYQCLGDRHYELERTTARCSSFLSNSRYFSTSTLNQRIKCYLGVRDIRRRRSRRRASF